MIPRPLNSSATSQILAPIIPSSTPPTPSALPFPHSQRIGIASNLPFPPYHKIPQYTVRTQCPLASTLILVSICAFTSSLLFYPLPSYVAKQRASLSSSGSLWSRRSLVPLSYHLASWSSHLALSGEIHLASFPEPPSGYRIRSAHDPSPRPQFRSSDTFSPRSCVLRRAATNPKVVLPGELMTAASELPSGRAARFLTL